MKPKNSLAYRFPEIAAEWDFDANGEIHPKNVSYGSGDHFGWICSTCGYRWSASVNDRTSGHGCYACDKKNWGLKLQERAALNNNLEEWCKKNDRTILLDEWNYELNEKKPHECSAGSNDYAHWICNVCGNRWSAQIYNRTFRGSNCKKCWDRRRKDMHRNDKAVEGDNSLIIWCQNHNRMELLEQWDYEKNEFPPENYSYGSNREVHWKCSHGHEWSAKIKARTTLGNGCKKCRYIKNSD